jgi:hypothetical protein
MSGYWEVDRTGGSALRFFRFDIILRAFAADDDQAADAG